VRPPPVSQRLFRRFVRGKEAPRGVVWFGAQSFWGHLRHLLAAAIASDNIDSRDWMTPDDPDVLRTRILELLDGDPTAASLVEGLGRQRDLYIDFVADTGDDVAVSRAVARLVFAPYELPDPDRPGQFLNAPRGDILFFGGDTAYPVATAQEILNRVIVPWNQVLAALPADGRRRVLLGIPGNHDWYDGLDGFGRMFRCRASDAKPPAPLVGVSSSPIVHSAEWALEFMRGGAVDKPEALVLSGYTPVQGASHFVLRLGPEIDLLAIDRQLTVIDPRQRDFFKPAYRTDPGSATLVVMPDPVHLFGDPSKTGMQMVESLHLRANARQTFVLSGDIHHYERSQRGDALHVIAGGGGAFLHPARIAKGGLKPTVSWPGVAQSRLLLRDVPWKLALGRSGLLPHFCLSLLYLWPILFDGRLLVRVAFTIWSVIGTTVGLGIVLALLGGGASRQSVVPLRRRSVWPLAFAAAAVMALIPLGASLLVSALRPHVSHVVSSMVVSAAALVVAVFAGTLVFGGVLTLFTMLGHEHMQALTALDHPGFKHFVRLRVRADGTGIDGWCIGVTDPLGPGARPELVDRFVWRPFAPRGS
jgi:hypothetical protein